MGTPNSAYISIVVVSGMLSILLGLFAIFKKSSFTGIRPFILMSFASAVYSFGFALELASGTLAEIKHWIALEYVGMPFVPPLSLIVILHYVGLDKYASRRSAWLLLVIPAVTTVMVMTNESHHLFYQSVYLRAGTPSPMADVVIGEWYLVHGGYTFACLTAGVYFLLRQWKRTRSAYRLQLMTMLAGLILPMAGALLYLFGMTPDGMDPVPFVLCVTTFFYIWAIFSNDLLTVVPIARELIFESMRDGVLVLDSAQRLIDYNQAAARMLPSIRSSSIGKPLDRIWTDEIGSGNAAAAAAEDGQAAAGQPFVPGDREIEWAIGDDVFHYQIRSSIIRKRGSQETGTMIVLIDITEQKQMKLKLQQLAYYDGLTGIYNRTQFLQGSKRLLEQSRLSHEPLSLILFDIDHFKQINDTFGHETGDEALRHIVSICEPLLREGDLFGRYGGEEFVICLPSCPLEQAGRVAERLRAAIESSPLMTTQGSRQPIPLTASFGAAVAHAPEDSLEAMLRLADQALYGSKRKGRNQVHLIAADGSMRGLYFTTEKV